MILLLPLVVMEHKLSSEYQELQRRINESIHKEEARRKILKAKREEKNAIKKAGGGKQLAKIMLEGKQSNDTDFNFGANESKESIDQRIAREHAERCMERVRCDVCGFSFGFCQELQDEKEKLRMLPSGNEPTTGKRNPSKTGINWLSVEDLTNQPQEAKILQVNYNKEGRFGARVEMKLAFNGEIIYWGVPPRKDDRNPNYKSLLDKFGPNENDWVDQRILLYNEAHKFYEGQYFIRVDFPAKKGNK